MFIIGECFYLTSSFLLLSGFSLKKENVGSILAAPTGGSTVIESANLPKLLD
jgi:hypothetical protein